MSQKRVLDLNRWIIKQPSTSLQDSVSKLKNEGPTDNCPPAPSSLTTKLAAGEVAGATGKFVGVEPEVDNPSSGCGVPTVTIVPPKSPVVPNVKEGSTPHHSSNLNTTEKGGLPHSSVCKLTGLLKEANQPLTIPCQHYQNRRFNFQREWYNTYKWIHYDESVKGILCFVCMKAKSLGLFSSGMKIEEAFTSSGYGNWKNGNEKLSTHDRSATHRLAVSKILSYQEAPIVKQISSTTITKQAEARKALRIIFTSIIYLGKQGLALRGSENDKGNCVSLLQLRSNDVEELKAFLCRPKLYTSGEIQNEILEIIAHAILRKITKTIQDAKFFSVIVDETSDFSVHEQVSISVRVATKNLDVEEFFLGWYETSSTTGEDLSKLILDCLLRFGLSIENLRGQCYNGASNMSGQFRGVQARISAIQPKAIYVHCFNHSLNLAIQDTVTKKPFFRDILSNVHDIGTILKGSPKRMAEFEEHVSNHDVSALVPRPLCPTRWTVREKAIIAVLKSYEPLMDFLDELGSTSDHISTKARGLRTQLEKGEFYLGLVMAKTLFGAGEALCKILETPTVSVSGAIESATLTITRLLGLKTQEHFDSMWSKMVERIDTLDLECPSLPRKRRRPAKYNSSNSSPEVFVSPEDRLMSLYAETIDFMCEEIGRRFDQPGLRRYEKLESTLLEKSTDTNDFHELCEFYGWDAENLACEISVLRNSRKSVWSNIKDVVDQFKSLTSESRDLLPTLREYLQHILVVPCSSAGAERSFSRLRRIKSYLRSTMAQSRLNHCCIINCYANLVDELDLDAIIQTFIDQRNREATFGKFKS